MKSFIGSLVVFALMLTMIVCNHIYITRACEELTLKLEALPPCESAEASVADLVRFWEKEKGKFGISISKQVIDKMTLAIRELAHAAKNGDTALFEGARIRAGCLAEEMRSTESLRAQNWI